jgi:hypothetical protein
VFLIYYGLKVAAWVVQPTATTSVLANIASERKGAKRYACFSGNTVISCIFVVR